MSNIINNFDIDDLMKQLAKKRRIFHSEADFQLEFGWLIKEKYPEAKVRMEYCPDFDRTMHIDILVIIEGKWIPIELKYKTKESSFNIDEEVFQLKGHNAQPVNRYKYLYDIQRIEKIRKNEAAFLEGYTVFLTNDLGYKNNPKNDNTIDCAFTLKQGVKNKQGKMDWNIETSEGTKKGCKDPIILEDEYPIDWKDYRNKESAKSDGFIYLANKVEKHGTK